MASILSKGSSGSSVRKLQEALNGAGYNLTVDGVFGDKTYNAVKNYQKANGLSVDGIVGDQTWGKLSGGLSVTNPDQEVQAPTTMTTPMGTEYDPDKTTGNMADLNALEGKMPAFQPSQAYSDALAELEAHRAQKPGAYTSPYSDQIAALYEQTQSRAPFQYDAAADPIYKMYADRYTQSARQSAENAMAEAAALTGGYGNSYAAAAAQQAYDAQMNGLNDMLPQLQEQAYSRYQSEGDALLEQLAAAQAMDERAYGRYRDDLNDYYAQLETLNDAAQQRYNQEYGAYQDALNAYLTDRDYYYNKTLDDREQANYENELALSQSGKSSGGSSGRSSGSGSGTASSSKSVDYKTILSTAQGMSTSKAYDYVARMVDQGYISPEEGDRILSVELGIDVGAQARAEAGEKAAQMAQTVTSGIANSIGSIIDKLRR